ncbi:MAG: hypothetical protein AB1478_04625 [Nitrospirota bacterium]
MVYFANTTDEDRLIRLENKAVEIRKILLGGKADIRHMATNSFRRF